MGKKRPLRSNSGSVYRLRRVVPGGRPAHWRKFKTPVRNASKDKEFVGGGFWPKGKKKAPLFKKRSLQKMILRSIARRGRFYR